MEKSQYDLCLEVLRRLNRAGVLKEVILIGSWCVPFYQDYFSGIKYSPTIRTRDVDFLVPHPRKIQVDVSVPDLLRDLGFIVDFQGTEGYVKLVHPDLVVEFLSPEKGKGTDKPVPIPKLGVNAVALRFLNLLTESTIQVKRERVEMQLPHPANFALHKLIISQRRFKEDKAAKDKDAAVNILRALVAKGEAAIIKRVFDSMIPKWRKKVRAGLEEAGEKDILTLLA